MANQSRRKIKLKWLAWAGFIILLLLAGFGPLAMLISFTWNEYQGGGNFWERLLADPGENRQPIEPIEEVIVLEPYMVQYLYRYCNHSSLFQPGNIPPEYPQPPRALAEIAVALHNSNLTIENLMEELKAPPGWYLADVNESNEGRAFFMLTYMNDLCSRCAGLYYLGIFDQNIAVYQGSPPDGKLVEITDIEVREIDRQELENGVVFETEEQKSRLLESFSS